MGSSGSRRDGVLHIRPQRIPSTSSKSILLNEARAGRDSSDVAGEASLLLRCGGRRIEVRIKVNQLSPWPDRYECYRR
jgi:hypothetical protein